MGENGGKWGKVGGKWGKMGKKWGVIWGGGANNKNCGARVDRFEKNATTFSTALRLVCSLLMQLVPVSVHGMSRAFDQEAEQPHNATH